MAHVTMHLRPPQEMYSPAINVSEGCSHGKCLYCSSYRYDKFRPLPDEIVISEIEEVAKTATALTNRIYLTGGNPFGLPTKRLVEIFDSIEERIPAVRQYGGFCCIRDIKHKTDEELALLASRGVDNISIGAESGWDALLEYMDKGQTSADIIEQSNRLHSAGIDFTFFYLAGLAGAGRGQENAIKSAEIFSEAAPKQILIVSIVPVPEWPLSEEIESGRWTPPGEEEIAREIQTFIANLTCPTSVNCSHDSDIIKFNGMIPKDQENMVKLLDNMIPKMNEKASRRVRELIHGATF